MVTEVQVEPFSTTEEIKVQFSKSKATFRNCTNSKIKATLPQEMYLPFLKLFLSRIQERLAVQILQIRMAQTHPQLKPTEDNNNRIPMSII